MYAKRNEKDTTRAEAKREYQRNAYRPTFYWLQRQEKKAKPRHGYLHHLCPFIQLVLMDHVNIYIQAEVR